jgi:3-hydroxyacyl-CoA dehydrogenase/enoyl-CoA hydratase/3-hydroxybutyryl-CoA epimerase
MPLLEVIRGEQTSDDTLRRAFDVAKLLGKTPILVNDRRGFFTSRVITSFVLEGIAMLLEGIPAASLEQASSQAGYPVPVLQLTDELNINLLRKIQYEATAAAEPEVGVYTSHPAYVVIDCMLDDFARGGRLAGAGFYDYEDGRRAGLWSGLRDTFGGDNHDVPLADLAERMLFIESLETLKCLDEGVIESNADANVGSVLGIGFPAWTGGVIQYVNGYTSMWRDDRRGVAGFVERARELAAAYGDRFDPPSSLVDRAERGDRLTDETPAAA